MASGFKTILKKHRSAADDKLLQRRYCEKKSQIEAAVQYCTANECKGYAAIRTGQFPLIKDARTINRRLESTPESKRIVIGEEKLHLRLLTLNEEECLVRFLINKNRACQGLSPAEGEKLILDMLRVRDHMNRTSSGRKYIKLTDNAKKALQKNKIGRGFWRRFKAAHPEVRTKQPGTVSINRALNCTRDMAATYLDELATELIAVGIFKNAERRNAGVWRGNIDTSRMIAHETPQFINYGPEKRGRLVFCGKGDECHKLMRENRECVTIQPFSTFSGEMILVQVVFAGKGVTSHMAPAIAVDSIENLLISATAYGVSTHESLLDAYKMVDKYLTQKEVQRPVVVISDGHSSRTDADTLKFLFDELMRLFLLPSNTSGVTQKHDQINQNIHKEYQNAKEELFTPFANINHEGFMTVLSKAWPRWVQKEDLVAAGKRVGIAKEGLDVNWMDTKKFERAELILGSTSSVTTPSTPTPSSPCCNAATKTRVSSPVNVRKGSRDYYKLKLQEAERLLNERTPDATDIPGLMSIAQPKPKLPSSKNVKVSHMHGSMTANDALAAATKIKEEKIEKEKKKAERESQKILRVEAFYRCKEKCQCDTLPCEALRLKECSLCHNILLTQCSRCKSPGGSKPEMIATASACKQSTSGSGKRRAKRKILIETTSESEEEEDQGDQNWDDFIAAQCSALADFNKCTSARNDSDDDF